MLDFSISNFANVFAKSYLVHEQLNPRNVLRLFLQETIRAVGASGTNQITLYQPRGYIIPHHYYLLAPTPRIFRPSYDSTRHLFLPLTKLIKEAIKKLFSYFKNQF